MNQLNVAKDCSPKKGSCDGGIITATNYPHNEFASKQKIPCTQLEECKEGLMYESCSNRGCENIYHTLLPQLDRTGLSLSDNTVENRKDQKDQKDQKDSITTTDISCETKVLSNAEAISQEARNHEKYAILRKNKANKAALRNLRKQQRIDRLVRYKTVERSLRSEVKKPKYDTRHSSSGELSDGDSKST